jgi:hypothetical protein
LASLVPSGVRVASWAATLLAEPGDLRRESILLGGLPAGLANGSLELPRGDAIGFFRGTTLAGGSRLRGAGVLESLPGRGRGRSRLVAGGRRRLSVPLEPRDVGAEALGAGPAFDRAVRGPATEPDDGLADDRRAVADDGQPTRGQRRLQAERRVEVRDDDGSPEQPRRRSNRIAPDRVDRPRPAAAITESTNRDSAGLSPSAVRSVPPPVTTRPRSAASSPIAARSTRYARVASSSAASTAARAFGSTSSSSSTRRPPRLRAAFAIPRASSSASAESRPSSRPR